MAIWIIALVLVLALCAIGYTQGVIKVAFTTLGLVVAGFAAMPLGGLFHPLFKKAGGDPVLMYVLSPIIAFAVVMAVFKAIGFAVSQKADTFFKYKTADLRQTMWQRLSDRAGLVLSVLNALGYTIFLCVVLQVLAYPAVQFSSGEKDGPEIQKLLQAADALEKSGMNTVAAAYDPTPAKFYHAVDVAGMLYHNPLLVGRFARYPGLLGLLEKDPYQAIANDAELTEKFQQHPPVRALFAQEKINTIATNIELVVELATNDFKDIKHYLETGETTKFGDEAIVGRWQFDLQDSLLVYRKENPRASTRIIMAAVERIYSTNIPNARITATVDKDVYLKLPRTDGGMQTLRGKWEAGGTGRYKISWMEGAYGSDLVVEPDRLSFKKDKLPVVFEREM